MKRLVDRDLARLLGPVAMLEVLIVVVAYAASGLGGTATDLAVMAGLVNMMLVIGLYVFTGLTGVFSFGHIAFMAIGGYTAGLLTIPPETKQILLPALPRFVAEAHLDAVPATLVGGATAMLVAVVLAVPLARLSGLAAGLGTFAILMIVHVVASNWEAVTGGDLGISTIPVTMTVTTAVVWVVIAVALIYVLQNLPLGLRVRACREDDVAARATGMRVAKDRAVVYAISGFVLGVGGALFVQLQGTASPDAFFLSITFLTIAMLVVGGTTSLAGAVVGAIVLSAVSELLRRVEAGVDIAGMHIGSRPGIREVGLAVVMLVVLLIRPRGITNGREIGWPTQWSARASGERSAEIVQGREAVGSRDGLEDPVGTE